MAELTQTYYEWQMFSKAEEAARDALSLSQDVLGAEHRLTLELMVTLGRTLSWGQNRFGEADARQKIGRLLQVRFTEPSPGGVQWKSKWDGSLIKHEPKGDVLYGGQKGKQ